MNRKIIGILICILFIVTNIVPLCVTSDNITINENNMETTGTVTLYPSGDTRVNQHSPYKNYGLSYLVICNMFGETSDYKVDILIKFDLSAIPNSASIISASLHLYYYDYWDTDPVGRPITCYRITSSWNEREVTWNTRPSYHPTVTSTAYVPSTWGWMSWDVKNDVSLFVSGIKTNYGWRLMDETYWGGVNIPQQLYKSREGSPKPYLEIEIEGNIPPNAPSKPDGPESGLTEISYTFSTSATDLENDKIRYGWDWDGDFEVDEWSELISSGATDTREHLWNSADTYFVRVKSEDEYGAQSDWSEVLVVVIESEFLNADANGPYKGNIMEDIEFDSTVTGGTPPYEYLWDYGDGNTSSGDPHPTHNYGNAGNYTVTLTVTDSEDDTASGTTWVYINAPPNKPIITGQINGKAGVKYEYEIYIEDPDGDDVDYCIDFDDGFVPRYSGYYFPSPLTLKHNQTWDSKGIYTIRARAMDEYGAQSDWGTLEVSMPKNKAINTPLFLQKLFHRLPFFEKILNQILL